MGDLERTSSKYNTDIDEIQKKLYTEVKNEHKSDQKEEKEKKKKDKDKKKKRESSNEK